VPSNEIQSAADSIEITLDANGFVVDLSAAARDHRLVRDVVVGQSLRAQIHADDYDFFLWSAQWILAAPGRVQTVRLRWARPNSRWALINVTLRRDPGQTFTIIHHPDEVEQARRAEAQLRRVVEGSAQGIVVRTVSDVLYVNDAFAHLLGFASARELYDHTAWELAQGIDATRVASIHPDDRGLVAEHMRRRLAGEETISHYEFRLTRRDGTTVWVDTRAALADWDGKPASLAWMSDISDRKAIQDELIRSKEAAELANRAKTEFLANMSHELRTPLNAIIGFAEVIKDEMFGPNAMARYSGYAQDIHSSGMHLLTLINDILDLAKLEAGKLDLREEDVALPELVGECLTIIRSRAQKSGIELVSAMDFGVGALHCDARAVKQVLLNFLSNAVKFTPDGGSVTTRVERVAEGLSISVTDNGIGMSPEQIEVAMSPFGQIDSKVARQHKGTGLGLPISKQLVELHGGKLTVRSAPGEGTTMIATFPQYRLASRAA
jgi:PAS domain S-box-containing protein